MKTAKLNETKAIITEGQRKLRAPATGKDPFHKLVFYNSAMAFNRTLVARSWRGRRGNRAGWFVRNRRAGSALCRGECVRKENRARTQT